jgi:hypothetical protein
VDYYKLMFSYVYQSSQEPSILLFRDPSDKSPVILCLQHGDAVQCLRRDENMTFVRYGAVEGYLRTPRLQLSGFESRTTAPISFERFAVHPHGYEKWKLREQPIDVRTNFVPVNINQAAVMVLRIDRQFAVVMKCDSEAAGWAKASYFSPALPLVFAPRLSYGVIRLQQGNQIVHPSLYPQPRSHKQFFGTVLLHGAIVEMLRLSNNKLACLVVDPTTNVCGWVPSSVVEVVSESVATEWLGEPSPSAGDDFPPPSDDGDEMPRVPIPDAASGSLLESVCRISDLAHQRDWVAVFSVLDQFPQLVNVARPFSRRRWSLLHKAVDQAHAGAVRRLVETYGLDAARVSAEKTFAWEHPHLKLAAETARWLQCTPLTLAVLLRREASRHEFIRTDAANTRMIMSAASLLINEMVHRNSERDGLEKIRTVLVAALVAKGPVRSRHLSTSPSPQPAELSDDEWTGLDDEWGEFMNALQCSLSVSYSPFHRFESTRFIIVADVVSLFWSAADMTTPQRCSEVASLQSLTDVIGLIPLEHVNFDTLLTSTTVPISKSLQCGLVDAHRILLTIVDRSIRTRQAQERIDSEANPSVVSGMLRFPSEVGLPSPVHVSEEGGVVRWLAIGDWGLPLPTLSTLAMSMAAWSKKFRPDFIISAGDNFYRDGISSVHDPLVKKLWVDVFMAHSELQVPWKVVLGNHDLSGNWQAQIDLTNAPHHLNPRGLWQMRGEAGTPCGRSYHFQSGKCGPGAAAVPLVSFFALDTTACQAQSSRKYLQADPDIIRRFREEDLPQFIKSASSATGRWKVAFGHHPMYTDGVGHQDEARRLRSTVYQSIGTGQTCSDGWGLEQISADVGLDLYISGHEHVMQLHDASVSTTKDPSSRFTTHHAVCGGTVEGHFYRGRMSTKSVAWSNQSVLGFMAFTATKDTLTIEVIDSRSSAVVMQKVITK